MGSEKPKVALLDTGIATGPYEKELFGEHGYRFEVFPGAKGDYEGKVRFASDAVGLLIRFTEINDYLLEQTPEVRAIARYGVGYDNIDLEACTRHGVRCANVRGYGNHSVSDHALAMILGGMRMLKMGQQNIYSGFSAAPVDDIPETHQQVLGIIGLGRIGSTLARKSQGLFKEIIACDPYISDRDFVAAGAENVTLKELLQSADIISIHCNLTEETHHLLDEQAFSLMEKKPVLVNTARGEIIKEEALRQALESGTIYSAGLDVFHTELPEKLNRDLVEHPRVMATGHYAWYSSRAKEELQKRTAQNLLALLQGETPGDCLNPECKIDES